MTTISEEYRALNRALHESNPNFGSHARTAFASQLFALSRQLGSEDVLDYGCGKGGLAKAMAFPIREYDPAVAGKDATPAPADIVACFDVMEHIEPEYLDAVFAELKRLVKRIGVFVVSTRLAHKTLADGRNAHLIVQPAHWWTARFREHFSIEKSEVKASEAAVEIWVAPLVKRDNMAVTKVRSDLNAEERKRRIAERAKLVQANMDANGGYAPLVLGHGRDVAEPIAVVGYGPSLLRTWERLRGYKYIWTTSGAHDFLLERGIVPTYHTDVDWQTHKLNFVKTPHPEVQYRMCNGVHPTYLQKLAGSRLTVFAPSDLPEGEYKPLTGEYPEMPKAGNVGQQASWLAFLDGWRAQHWFGIDHSYVWSDPEPQKANIADATKHAGWHKSAHAPGELIYVQVAQGRRFYESSYDLVCSGAMMVDFAKTYNLKPVIFGDSLLKDWMRLTGQCASHAGADAPY